MKLEERKELNKLLKWHIDNFDKLCGIKTEKGKLKMFNLTPETVRFKKIKSSLKKAIINLNILSLLFLFACGDNPVNNNMGSNENTIFFQDSLSIVTPPFSKDTNITVSAKNIKITFTAETNADSINGWSLFKVTSLDTNNLTILDTTYNRISSLNNNFEFSLNSPNTKFITLYIQCLRNPPYVFFMRLKNIKIISLD